MKRILFVYDRMMTGGTTTALLSLLNEIDYTKYEVDLLLFDFGGEFLKNIPSKVKILEPALVKGIINGLNVSKRKLVLTILNGAALKAAIAYCKYRNTKKGNIRHILMHYGVFSQVAISRKLCEEYDVAIGFIEGWADHYVLSNKVKAKKKLVWFHPDYLNSYLIPEVDRAALKHACHIVCVSKTCEKHMKQVFPEFRQRITTIENVSSNRLIHSRAEEETPKIDSGKINICTIARCDISVKGLDRVISALAKLKEEKLLDGTLWHYIGTGPEIDKLKSLIFEKNVQGNVRIYGQRSNPLTYLKQMDAFVLASRYEGKPISVEEALSLGIPCIVTKYASAHEQIDDGVNGLIASNDDEGIYIAIKHYLESSEIREKLRLGICENRNDKTSMSDFYKLIQE